MRRAASTTRCALGALVLLGAAACEPSGGASGLSEGAQALQTGVVIAARAETDERPAVRVEVGEGPAIEATAVGADGVVVDRQGVAWRLERGARTRLLDRVHGVPVALSEGRWLAARLGDEPGESDLWIQGPHDGHPLAPAPGPDEQPTLLEDGRVLFVSGRTGVMSMWIVDVDGGDPRQLTNVGLAPGGPRDGFVPPPAGAVTVAAGRASWDDGYGKRWSVAIEEARR